MEDSNSDISDTIALDYSNSSISDTIVLDVAVLCQEYSPVDIVCDYNVIELDDIEITEQTFKAIFYPHGENFGIEKNICCSSGIIQYISFCTPYRRFNNGSPFSLLEQIILNLENDLNVTRSCFTTCSLIELSKELSNIKTLCDINCCSLLASLPWSNIVTIIRNDYRTRGPNVSLGQTLLVISIIFKTPNISVRPTVIKFKYRININSAWI